MLAKTLLADMGIVGPAQAAPKGALTADKLAAASASAPSTRILPGQLLLTGKGHAPPV
jgi:hypothetical protein